MFVSRRYGLDSLICSPVQAAATAAATTADQERVGSGMSHSKNFEPPHGCLAGMEQFAPLR